MENYFNLIYLALAIINVAAFIMVGIDKRKSVNDSERLPEVNFFLMSAAFGSLGIFLGMYFFHHKTRKAYFPLGVGFLLIQQVVLLWLVYKIAEF
ncbi:MAG: DUF1294 domain-containing protein [Candidatus Doudnabacteria bacterium]|nr:DUF1294 domain-containing protein [Candidatus Doudnabacteria bacterium]